MPETPDLSAYDVIWDTPSENASGSMPIGNGDLGANVWVEPNGDVLLLLGKTDAWDENSSLVKLGRVRLRFDPGIRPDGHFEQRLDISTATIVIRMGELRVRLYADANQPMVRVTIDSLQPISVQAVIETWRNYPYRMTPTQTGDMFKNLTGKDPYPTIITPDEVVQQANGELWVRHRNAPRADDPYAINMKLQGLGELLETRPSPLADRTFGMAVVGRPTGRSSQISGDDDGRVIVTEPQRSHQFDIFGLTVTSPDETAWDRAMRQLIDHDHGGDHLASSAHAAWWTSFWRRSHFIVRSTRDEQNAYKITRAYVLQRYMNASGGRGEFPIKHNGSIFTVGRPWDPDFRRWGGPGFWFMNQRLIYWPMLTDGDFDLMRPWLAMYRDTLPVQLHRTKKYFGHRGAHYPETMTFWGAEVSGHYGWTPFEQRERPEAECAYLKYYWSGAVELILILSEFVAHTGDETISRDMLLPIADAVTLFYDEHYPRETSGQLRFEPSQALETWHKAVDPMPEVAGLRYTLTKLLSLGVTMPDELRARCERILRDLPPLPAGDRDGEQVLLPAARFDLKKNTENPELYCIFPYRLFGVGKPDLELAKQTFARRLHVEHTCWHQDVIQMALLGMTDEAKDFLSRRAADECHSDSRFPAFWNAFHDWIPDIDHGGVLQIALQFMLVQCDGENIRLLPAWPNDWQADFKLHLPGPTVIEGRVRDGEVEHLGVLPESRRANVVIGQA